MAATHKWVGPKTLERGKAVWLFAAEKVTVNFSYTGPMTECLARRPPIGSVVSEFNQFGLTVASATATEGDGESGVLAVVLEADVPPADGVSFDPIGVPIYENLGGELTKALETHPFCGTLKPDRPHYKKGERETADPTTGLFKGTQRTWEDWADLDDDDYDDDEEEAWSLDLYKEKKEKGVDSYNEGAPVIRRTLYYLRKPIGVGLHLFRKQSPPVAADAPDGWQWLLTADDCTREGRRRCRHTEWTGARSIDSDIYIS